MIQPTAEPCSCNDGLIRPLAENKVDGLTCSRDVPAAPVPLPLVVPLLILVLKTQTETSNKNNDHKFAGLVIACICL